MSTNFNEEIVKMLDDFIASQKAKYPASEVLTMDLHCHDHNSNVPDEQLGRILGVPETWLHTEDLLNVLKSNGCNAFTVTNHNNARSCWYLLEKGIDVLVGAEFSCVVPDFQTGIHVLAYGFTPEQETRLNKYRSDIYRFQEYTCEQNIPTIWAHPLYHYRSKGLPPMEFFDKMALLFERFEVINGQRDSWQNMLVKRWIESLTPERIQQLAKKYKINPRRYCRNPYLKAFAAGSDSHMGIFTGLTGVYLYVPNLAERLKLSSRSALALEAIKRGEMAPFGSHNESEKLAIAFLDYFCQVGIHLKDPGIVRILLHKGTPREKLIAFIVANACLELKRHKTTMTFLNIFHECFIGKAPAKRKRLVVKKDYKEVFEIARQMALVRRDKPEKALGVFDESIARIFEILLKLLVKRAEREFEKMDKKSKISQMSIEELVDRFEMPSHFRELFDEQKGALRTELKGVNLSKFFDNLSFPFLSSAVILSAFFASARVMYKARPLLNEFAQAHNTLIHPERTLWLTDTFEDSNGVAMVLKSMLHEIRKRNLPIDMLVASNTLQSGNHLIVIKPVGEYRLPFYEQQPLRIPNLLEIHKIFKRGEYNKIVCSTEGPMGLAALYLKYAYSVPAYFYVHTDWMTFAERVLKFSDENKSRLRRILRTFYKGFDGLFVLNNDQRKWLIGKDMGFDPNSVFLTAHWADEGFKPKGSNKEMVFGVKANEPVLLFAGRLSDEKGVMEIPLIMERVWKVHPSAKVAFAGMGPKEKELREKLPQAIFLGWVDHQKLPEVYSAADMLILPSRFDTFGCVVLEALSCGLPVAAYNTKGPKDIVIDGVNGYLAKNVDDIAEKIIDFLNDKRRMRSFKKEALKRARQYDVNIILSRFLHDLGIAA